MQGFGFFGFGHLFFTSAGVPLHWGGTVASVCTDISRRKGNFFFSAIFV